MAIVDLKTISLVDALKLRIDLDARLAEMKTELDGYWDRINISGPKKQNGVSALKGVKIKPKYRGPNGETWAGRGAKPRWMTAAMKKGRKLESFLIK